MTPRSAKEARQLGLTKYYTGEPCRHGHVEWRQVSNNSCMACQRATVARYAARHPDKVAAVRKSAIEAHRANPEKKRAYWRAHRAKDPEKARRVCRLWYDKRRKGKPHPSARKVAEQQGVTYFFTGIPCDDGHIGWRRTANGSCLECEAARGLAWHRANPVRSKESYKKYRVRHIEKVRAGYRAYREANRDLVLVRQAAWREGNRDKSRAASARWRANNLERAEGNTKKWRRENKKWIRKYSKEYREANPGIIKKCGHNRRARLMNAEGEFTAADIARITEKQRGRCAYCKKKKKLTVDHIVPLAKGGSNWPSNLQMTCRPCNSRKSARDPIAFAKELGMLL
jgi:5-methylcytosine-specific restriction endonuclease McrA